MSEASDVKAIVLGVKTVFRTSAAIDRVKINNNSSMYLRVYFGADAPSAASDTGWHDTIDPGDKPLLGIVGASASAFSDRTNYIQSTPYQGTITILPFLPAGQFLQSGGIIGGGSFCHLTGYYPQEYADSGTGDEAYVQAAKQARYQAIGGSTERWVADISSVDASKDFTLINGAAFYTLTPARCPALFAAWNDATTWPNGINVNHYYYGAAAHWRRTAAGVAGVVGRLEAVIRNPADAADVTVETLSRWQFGDTVAGTQNSAEHSSDQPCRPMCVALFIGRGGFGLQTGDIVRLRWIREATAGSWTVLMNADVLIDMLNQSIITDVPYVPSTFASPSNAPYNANSNPQTW